MAQHDVFNLQLEEFANTCPCRRKKTDNEIPVSFHRIVQPPFEVSVICVAYDIFKKWILLNADERHLEFRFANASDIAVERKQTNVDRLWLESFKQTRLIKCKRLLVDLRVECCELT